MKEKIFRIFSSNIKIRVSGRNINNFIKRIIKNNIKIVKLTPRSHKEIDLIIDYNDLEEIEKYKTIYDIKIVRYYGKLHIIKFLKKNRFILLFLLLGMIIVFILSNMIFNVEVIHSNSKIIKLVTEELKDRGIKKYAFAKSYSEVEKIEKEILNNNKDNLEWLEIIRNGTKYTVRVEERIINKEIDDNKNYDIVSSKNAVIRVIEAESGEKVRDINTYVKKGETIISAYITTPSEERILSTARGKVIGEVWGQVEIAKTVAKFKTAQDFMEKTFGERDKALSKHYDLLDDAIKSNDRDMILAALHGISSIVTKSPLDDFEKFVELYNDTSQPLLDF